MNTLNDLGLRAGTDKSSAYHNYLSLYSTHFSHIRERENRILEIGILKGESLKIFETYFPNSEILGIDIHDKKAFETDRIKTICADQSDINFLSSFEDSSFDVILDDGSHRLDHQQISFGYLFSKLKPGGIYIIEDLHTSLLTYTETVRYGLDMFGILSDGSNSTIDFLRGLEAGSGPNHYLPAELYDVIVSQISTVGVVETANRGGTDVSITSVIYKK
jgi:hypothetical protein